MTVADELNFTRAAERLFIAQQALASQILQLEMRLGEKLFERTTRRVSLTGAGEPTEVVNGASPLVAGYPSSAIYALHRKVRQTVDYVYSCSSYCNAPPPSLRRPADQTRISRMSAASGEA